jgi:hypothetical protein
MKTVSKPDFIALLEGLLYEYLDDIDGYAYARDTTDGELVRCKL